MDSATRDSITCDSVTCDSVICDSSTSNLLVLTENQLRAVKRVQKRKHCILNAGVGSGKTWVSLFIARKLIDVTNKNVLIVCPPHLLTHWMVNVEKYLPHVKTEVLANHNTHIVTPDRKLCEHTRIVIMSMSVLQKCYTVSKIEKDLVVGDGDDDGDVVYRHVNKPLREGQYGHCVPYAQCWGHVIVDEMPHNGDDTKTIRSIVSLSTDNTCILSATPVREPGNDRQSFALHLLTRDDTTPKSYKQFKTYKRSAEYDGVAKLMVRMDGVYGKSNAAYEYTSVDIIHEISTLERMVWEFFADTLEMMKEYVCGPQYTMAVLTMYKWLVQSLVCCQVPLRTIVEKCDGGDSGDGVDGDSGDGDGGTFLKLCGEQLRCTLMRNDDFAKWFKDNDAASERFMQVKKIVDDNDKDTIVIFSESAKVIPHVRKFLTTHTGRECFAIYSKIAPTPNHREITLDAWRKTSNGILIITTGCGGTGINLTHSSVIIHLHVYHNSKIAKQANGRLLRNGQQNTVRIYNLYSNTGLEKTILEKCQQKNVSEAQLLVGPNCSVKSTKIDDIIQLVDKSELSQSGDNNNNSCQPIIIGDGGDDDMSNFIVGDDDCDDGDSDCEIILGDDDDSDDDSGDDGDNNVIQLNDDEYVPSVPTSTTITTKNTRRRRRRNSDNNDNDDDDLRVRSSTKRLKK